MAQNKIYMGTKAEKKNDEFTYEVKQECGTISSKTYTTRNGEEVTEEKKLRLISWNGNEPKYDIRPWKITDEGEKCLKAGGLTGEELIKLGEIINEMVKASEPKPKACRAKANATLTQKISKAKTTTKKGTKK